MERMTVIERQPAQRRDPRANPVAEPATAVPAAPANPVDVARYVADITAELAVTARAAGHDLVAYLIDIAHLEASTKLRQLAGQRSRGIK